MRKVVVNEFAACEQVVDQRAQVADLPARWDAGGGLDVLKALRDQFLERNYIHNLLDGIEREQNASI